MTRNPDPDSGLGPQRLPGHHLGLEVLGQSQRCLGPALPQRTVKVDVEEQMKPLSKSVSRRLWGSPHELDGEAGRERAGEVDGRIGNSR